VFVARVASEREHGWMFEQQECVGAFTAFARVNQRVL
jgi:hypothetical protein